MGTDSDFYDFTQMLIKWYFIKGFLGGLGRKLEIRNFKEQFLLL